MTYGVSFGQPVTSGGHRMQLSAGERNSWRLRRRQQGTPGAFRVVPFESELYCVLSSDRYGDLPALMVGYLEATFAAAAISAR